MPITEVQLASARNFGPIVLQNNGSALLARQIINLTGAFTISDNPSAYSTTLNFTGGASGGGSGSVTTVSVATANGLSGTVANATTTPAITLSTTVNGVLKGNSGAIQAAAAGTDYQAPISVAAYSVFGNSGSAAASGQSIQSIILGVPGFVDTGISVQNTNAVTGYAQYIVQNTTAASAASADYVAANDLGTATSNYADFGINSSQFQGTGPNNIPGAGYAYNQSGDMLLATNSPTGIVHIAVNNVDIASANSTSFNVSNVITAPLAFVNRDNVSDHLAALDEVVRILVQTMIDNDMIVPDELTQYLIAS